MTELLLALAVFILTHAVSAVRPLRRKAVESIGIRVYTGLYSILSVGVLVWLGYAYAQAPYIELWVFEPWMRWVPLLLMPLACLLLVSGLFEPNPLSIGFGDKDRYDPQRPGIVGITRHPVIWGIGLWALAHLVPNGDAASVILFSLLLLAGLAGPVSVDARRLRVLGKEDWDSLASSTSSLPFWSLLKGQTSLRGLSPAGVVGGSTLYVALLILHEWIIGVSPMP